ncbi:hypothetical protein [Rhodoferax aquaticus]|uniref:Uncharacterized protein n=1 Tax=Rhodoferax aquaticus TaxID=2527691 RepID=A0A515ELQ4_9BURK|nr:hypothetical protein [Rhodoferax aquaticus]QDL53588.1 hypothetical protein EXZ61_05020 [Rhodoferax aquaticus]
MSYYDTPKPRATQPAQHLLGNKDVDDLCHSDEALVQLYEIDGEVETPRWSEKRRAAFLTEAS